jgi:predicted DNA-binding WGR domain protein
MSNDNWRGNIIGMEYHDNDANSHKFYQVAVLCNDALGDYRVVTRYGRVGSNGQSGSKIVMNEAMAQNYASRRADAKVSKGYNVVSAGWEDMGPNQLRNFLQDAGVNTRIQPQVTTDEGVTFDEMSTLVGSLLTQAVGKDNDAGDVIVAAATMNAKMATLREQFEDLESEVEFVNTAVRSRI